MNKEQLLAIIQGGHLTDGDLADALLAELVAVACAKCLCKMHMYDTAEAMLGEWRALK